MPAARSLWVKVFGILLACCLWLAVVTAVFSASSAVGATTSDTARTGHRGVAARVVAAQSAARVFEFVYAGSGLVMVVQHVDNRPGHAGPEWDDTYRKQVKWSISWPVTIDNGQVVKIGDPTATMSGTASAEFKSGAGQSCHGPVMVPVANGKPYVVTTFEVVDTTPRFITVRLRSFPLAWAAAPACVSGEGTVGHVQTNGGPAATAWGNSFYQPEFKIALANNYKITPASVGNTFPFTPTGDIHKIVFDWNARLTIAGFGPPKTPAPTKPLSPPRKTPEPVRQAALAAANATMSWAEYVCTIPRNPAVGSVIVLTGGGQFFRDASIICAQLLSLVRLDLRIYDDPPLSGYTRIAHVAGTVAAVAQRASCSRYTSAALRLCQQLQTAEPALPAALARDIAVAAALETTVGRESAAAAAGNKAAVARQQQNALKLLPRYTSTGKDLSAVSSNLARIFQAARVTAPLTRSETATAIATVIRLLKAKGVTAAQLRAISPSLLHARQLDLVPVLSGHAR